MNVPFIIDVEASGFGPQSYPVEIGVALQRGTRHSVLIQPAPGWDFWDLQAEKVHRISRDILMEYGKPVAQVTSELNALLAGHTLYSDGWVVDKPWLSLLFHAARTTMAFEVSPIERLLPASQMAIWDNVKVSVIDELAVTRHRASHDAMMIQETWVRSRRYLDGDTAADRINRPDPPAPSSG